LFTSFLFWFSIWKWFKNRIWSKMTQLSQKNLKKMLVNSLFNEEYFGITWV
jgi:hypothetical protein